MRLIDADALFEVIKKSMAENPHKEKMQRAMHIHEHKYFLTLLTTFPTIQPVATDTNVGDIISIQAAVELVMKYCPDDDGTVQCDGDIRELLDELENLPPAQPEPSEITDEQAILHLQSTGWMQNHDREMYESGLREQLADDSGGYDSLIPCEDTISRQAAIDAIHNLYAIHGSEGSWIDQRDAFNAVNNLPSAQPELKWIPCSKQLPKQGQEVICQCRANIIKVLKLDAYGDWYQDAEHCYMGGFVIAWMPLPEPYKEGGADVR